MHTEGLFIFMPVCVVWTFHFFHGRVEFSSRNVPFLSFIRPIFTARKYTLSSLVYPCVYCTGWLQDLPSHGEEGFLSISCIYPMKRHLCTVFNSFSTDPEPSLAKLTATWQQPNHGDFQYTVCYDARKSATDRWHNTRRLRICSNYAEYSE